MTASLLLALALGAAPARAADTDFIQDGWAAGAVSGSTTSATSGWQAFDSQDGNAVASSTSLRSLTGIPRSWTQTDDGTGDSGFSRAGSLLSSVTLQGTGAGAFLSLALREAVLTLPQSLPQARQLMPAVYDPGTRKIYLFGGELPDGTLTNSVLEFDPATGSVQTAPDALPTARAGASAAYDPGTNAIYVFGGFDAAGFALADILRYDPIGHSVQLVAVSLPTARSLTSAAEDPVTGRIYVFGGKQSGAGTNLADIIAFDPGGQTVTAVSTTLPSGRMETAAAYEPASGDVLVFGGNATGTWLSDVVAFHPLGSSTTLLSPLPTPEAGLSAARNPLTGRIYLYGGDDGGTPSAAVLEFDPSSRRVDARPPALPSPRARTAAAADPAQLGLYVFGGTVAAGGFADVLENVQVASGVYQSSVFDTANLSQLGSLGWNPSVQADTSTAVGLSFRSGNVAAPGPTWSNGGLFLGVANGGGLAPLGSSRYVQYAATFTTTNLSTSPILADLTVTFTQTAASATVVSSAFDSGQAGDVIRRLSWSGVFQPGTTSEFQLRSAPDDGTGHPGTWTPWLGPTAATDYYTDPNGGQAINPEQDDGVGDRFFQYKTTLLSSGTLLPAVLSTVDVTVNYLPAAPTQSSLVAPSTSEVLSTFVDESNNETDFVLSTGTLPGATNLGASTPTANASGTGGTQAIVAGGLLPNTAYFVRVRARDAPDGILSGYSNELNVFTLADAPVALSVTSVTLASATLSWSPAGNPANTPYEVSLSTDGFQTDFSTPVPFAASLTADTTALLDLSPGTTYSLRVRALNGNAVPSAFSAVLTTATPASALAGLGGFALGTSSVTWDWSPSGPAARYQVFSSSSGVLLADTAATSFTLVGLSTNAPYGVQVQPYVGATFGALSPAATVFTAAADPAAAAAVSLGTGAIALSWGADGNPAGTRYEVSLSTAGFPLAVSTPVPLAAAFTALTTTFVGLSAGTTHFWRVRAYNGDSLPSGFAFASTETLPGVVTALSTTSVGVSSLAWSWAASAGPAVTSYVVARASDGVVLATTSATAFAQAALSTDAAYGLSIAAVDGAGTGALSPPATAFTLAAPPSGTSVAAVYVDSVTLSWAADGNPAYALYEVDAATPGGAFAPVSAATGTSFTAVNLLPETSVQFEVRAMNGDGVPTAFDLTVSTFVAGRLPLPPSAFRATPLGGASIGLSWTVSPTTTVVVYDLFSDGGTGTVAYGVLLASVAAPATTFITPPLTPNATYVFGIRSVDQRGVSDGNVSVQASAVALGTAPALSAYVRSPPGGAHVWGNRLTVTADAAAGALAAFRRVDFQFRASSSAAWQDMAAAEPAHVNPAASAPFLTIWDVTALAAGAYEVRAVARGADGVDDPAPPVTTLIVGPTSPDVSATLLGAGRVLTQLKVYRAAPATLDAADPAHAFTTRVDLSTGCIAADQDVLSVDGAPSGVPQVPSAFSSPGIFRAVSLASGQSALSNGACATLSLSQLDQDGDRRVDGTETRSDDLVWTFYDAVQGAWRADFPSQVLASDGGTLAGGTPHFTLFAAMSPAAPDLATLRVYPVPYRPNGGNPDYGKPYSASDPTSGIIIDDLPADARLSVYTVAGSLVWDAQGPAQGGLRRWDARTGDGREVASGVYFLVVTAPDGSRRVEKLVIIR